jgi:tetratricopeptide (TPR) repeat protein
VDEQIADLSSRLEREPGSAPLLLRRGELHRAHGDRSAAERDFRAALAADPALHAVHLAWGRVRLEAGDPALALATLDRFIAAQPGHPDALRLRGRALALLGRPWQAADSFTAAIAASLASGGTDPALYLERAAALQSAGGDYLPEALSGLEDGIARLGAPSTLVLAAADLEEKLGRIEAAVARLDGAARNARRPERWRARQGEILEKAGRAEEARRAYEAALFSFAALPESRRRARAGAEIEASVRAALERMAERRGEAP